ncbi:MAG: hypothetical protein KGZ71_12600 [Desulfobulbaceae bacterium]|nr:hypothetical protein [Desulfobulbaceae bacterium]
MKYLLFLLILLTFDRLFSQDTYYVEHAYKFNNNVLTSIMDFKCIDENNCILLKTDNNATGLMLEKTTDGGNSWELIYADTSFKSTDSIYYPQYWGVKCEYFSNGKIIILTNRGHIIVSEDFGTSFKEYPQIENYSHKSFVMLDSINAFATSVNWAQHPDSEIKILKSTDACKKWENFSVPDSINERWFYSKIILQKDKSFIIRLNRRYGFESDSTKNYFYHTNFENSFGKLFVVPNYVEYIYFFDENEAFSTGRIVLPGSFNDTAITSKTYDAGNTWEIRYKTTWPYEMFTSQLVHNDTTILISGSGFGFFQSSDKGESWYKPIFHLAQDLKDTIGTWSSSIWSYFDNGTIYFDTYIFQNQFLKGTRVGTSVYSPSVKPKRIYPNPVTYGSDFIAEYEIATSGHLKMYLSDLSGREVCPLYSDFAESGSYSISLRLPENISSGSYWLVSEQHGYKHVQLLNVVK